MNKKIEVFLWLTILFFSSVCYAESEGEKAFLENRPGDAVILLESDISSGIASPVDYNYLGLSYFQLGDFQNSVEAFNKGLGVTGTNKKLLAFNQGNSYYALRDYKSAAKSFSLALTADPGFYNALLNRANSYLMADNLSGALDDYKRYIIVVPEDPQKPEIIQLISALENEIKIREVAAQEAEREAARVAEEEKRMREEMERQAAAERERLAQEEAERKRIEEEKRAADAERRRKLLEDVANSLQNTDSTNMSAGAEDLIDYEQEAELD